jgi:type II secretory pathway pseudopilin PulG
MCPAFVVATSILRGAPQGGPLLGRCGRMPVHRSTRLVRGQGGSTLIELLVAMPIAVMLVGLVVQALGNAGINQQDIERRTEALTNGQLGLERMTGEFRQADWLYFRSSSVVDIQVGVRATPNGSATPRLVRWNCSTDVCTRSEGSPTTYPPPTVPTFTRTTTEIGSPATDQGGRYGLVTGHDVFTATSIDPQTGQSTVDFLDPDFLFIRLRLEIHDRGENVEISDGVSLRNETTFAE